MKKTLTVLSALLALVAAAAPSVIPAPKEMTFLDGSCTLPAAAATADAWALGAGLPPALVVEKAASVPEEGYELDVGAAGVKVRASTDAGAFYAYQTARQLATAQADGSWRMPCAKVVDAPRFRWRGVMVDDCRHFFGKESILKTLEVMAYHKMNTLHWHLTEDQGWRLAVPGMPELVKYGAYRPQSEYPDGLGRKRALDGKPYGPFYYTEQDVKEVLAAAKRLHIAVVPEIELPGHALAAIAAYPNLCCRGTVNPRCPWAKWGVSKDVFCAGNDDTIRFLEKVFDYVTGLFPGAVVHIGGDECPKARWKECPKCQKRIKDEGLKDEHELQGWITRHFTEYLAKKGKRTIGWDEIIDGGAKIPKETMVQSWRGARGGIKAAKAGHDVVMSPNPWCYFDYPQDADHKAMGYGYPTWARRTSLALVYSFDPLAGIPAEFHRHILGVQCNMWAESIVTPEEFQWKLWPRGCALAEVGWSYPAERDYGAFLERLAPHVGRLKAMGVNVAPLPPSPGVAVATWKKGDFTETFAPKSYDLSRGLKGPGRYLVSFKYERGRCRIDVRNAVFTAGGKTLLKDAKTKMAGTQRSAEYEMDVTGGELKFDGEIRTDGGIDSFGSVFVTKLP